MISLARKIRNLIIHIVDSFYAPFSRYLPLETFRYGATGGMNTALDIFLYFIVYNFVIEKKFIDLKVVVVSPHIAAFLIVFPITFCTGFILAKYVTFTQSPLNGKKQLLRYGLSVSGSILLNYLLLKLFVEVFGIWATLSKILTTIVVIIYSYITQKHFTFRTSKKALAKARLLNNQ